MKEYLWIAGYVMLSFKVKKNRKFSDTRFLLTDAESLRMKILRVYYVIFNKMASKILFRAEFGKIQR